MHIPASAYWSEDSAWGKFSCLFSELFCDFCMPEMLRSKQVLLTWFGQEVTRQICDLAERWLRWDLEDAGSDLSDWAEPEVQGLLPALGWAYCPQGYWPKGGVAHTHTRSPYSFMLSSFMLYVPVTLVLVTTWLALACQTTEGTLQVSLRFGSQFTFPCLPSRFHPLSKSVGGFLKSFSKLVFHLV